MISGPLCLSLSPITPHPTPIPHSPFQLLRLFISKLGRGVPPLRSSPFHPHRRRVQIHSSSIPTASASLLHPPPPRHICIPTLPRHPDPRTRTHPCPPPPTPHNSARLSHLGGSAAAAQKAALLQLSSGCCSRLLLLLLLSSPRCPRPDPGCRHRHCSCGVRLSTPDFSPHPPTPSPVPTPLELPLLPRPPPLAPRDGHALSGGCCARAAGLLKEPAAAIRRTPGSSLARLASSPPCWRSHHGPFAIP